MGRFDDWDADNVERSPCATCRWKHAGAATCAAFPGGIPRAILSGSNQHREPYPGDRGIRYEPLPAPAA